MKNILTVVIIMLFFSSCSQTFEPNGEYQQRMIVFSVLNSWTDTQYVRVYDTYDPNNNNPLTHSTDTEITDAVVMMTSGADTIVFHDTVIVRSDTTTLYGKFLHTYIAYKFTPKPGRLYTLTVKSPTRGNASAEVTSFSIGSVFATGKPYQTLASPNAPNTDTSITTTVQLAPEVPAYMVRLMLRFRQWDGAQWDTNVVEIPNYIREGQSFNDFIPYYSTVLRRGQYATGAYAGQELVSFSKEAYIAMVRFLKYSIGPSKIEFDGAYFILNQMSQSVYSYYSATNQTSETISIRLDQIDYTNIKGGYGLFGLRTTSESYFIKLPANIEVD